jgi:hypothetical protein
MARTSNSKEAPSKIGEYDRLPQADLNFDAQNPRLIEYVGKAKPSQPDLLGVLWDLMAVDEIAMSIAASGFWDHEPLLVVKENKKWVVIEGNRRLAAAGKRSCDRLAESYESNFKRT